MDSDGFVPILAIFYAVFHPTEGTKIVHQVPETAISLAANSTGASLFNFDTVKNYVIPKPQLCNKLISFKIENLRVLGYPVNIEGSRYLRNSFNFNFCFVFPYNSDTTPYELAIQRMGRMFRALEEQSFMLSKLDKEMMFFSDKAAPSTGKTQYTPGQGKVKKFTLLSIESLIHQIFQDLNNYSECCIPIDTSNSVDIKLFPVLPPPVNIKAFQVPLMAVRLHSLIDVNWDPTMVKILPFINGLNSVKRISELADADYLLTKQCIQHLMHYRCLTIVDIFQFKNVYAPTNNIGNFLTAPGMAEECQAYVIKIPNSEDLVVATPLVSATPATPGTPRFESEGSKSLEPASASPNTYFKGPKGRIHKLSRPIHIPSKSTLFYLYRLLNQGQTIKEWYIQHQKALENIDVRRFINFGVVRGLIYRLHSYTILQSVTKFFENEKSNQDPLSELVKSHESQLRRAAKQRAMSHASSNQELGLLRSSVNESNLKTGRKSRTVSFHYQVERFSQSDDTLSSDLEVFESDSDDSDEEDLREGTSRHSRSDDSESESSDEEDENKEELIKVIKLVKGVQHMDLICTELQKPRSEVEKLLDHLGAHFAINS
ncbi:hypothetical protein C7M61_003305 [Candidozyma pseudohaemuli]|uniref:Nitrogen permease regulator 2 n=1 Tax=Candidozyma pseudohaemuli TaxID=418784 RepID=A0A2P7YNR3_9ASCO|nr:hypothetical protein C7M61_003305 [[Candida] pseudohaemulonii]PSK37599.1 hypothetical protein C7M61_003305 [[Candida] pseudohaemulonii]